VRPFPPPSAFGAPSRYSSWRPQQLSATFQVSDSEKRFRGVTMPCGAGKTLWAFMLIAMHGERGLVLTENLGLMDQYQEDLRGAGCSVALLKGAGNYP
jgi:superfamily II DNA or RNA helicase